MQDSIWHLSIYKAIKLGFFIQLTSNILLFSLVILCPLRLISQEEARNEVVLLPAIEYGVGFPQQVMGNRFGTFSLLGLRTQSVLPRQWTVGLHYHFYFGNQVKTDVLQSLRQSNGSIIAGEGIATYPALKLRGGQWTMTIGKWFRKSNSNGGLWLYSGPSLLSHRIRIQDSDEPLAQLQGELRNGYDRHTSGWGAVLGLYYLYVSPDKQVNFFIGAQQFIGQTENKRGFNIDQGSIDSDKQSDGLLSVSAGWIIPFVL